MANTLILNQSFVSQGLDTLTYTVASDGIYNIKVSAQVPEALPTGAGSGSGADQGLGMLGGKPGIGQGANTSLGNGGSGLGFGAGTSQTTYNTDGNGHGAGAGGGTLAEFSQGGGGAGEGSVGQGFGADTSGYNQPPTDVHTPDQGAAVSSALVILVKKNGTTVFTAPTFTPTQSALQFEYSAPYVATDVISVTFSSANASDKQLNGTQMTVSVGQGQ